MEDLSMWTAVTSLALVGIVFVSRHLYVSAMAEMQAERATESTWR